MSPTFDYTYRNHLRAGWLSAPGTEERRFATIIGDCEREPMSGIAEAGRAAKLIFEKAGKLPTLCMSGGLDSEAMAEAFVRAGVPFKVAIAKYGPGFLNEDDLDDAFLFCEKHAIDPLIVEIDLHEFFDSGRYLEISREYSCSSPQLAVHLELLERLALDLGEVPVLAGNPIELECSPETGRPILYLPTEPHLCYLRFFISNRVPGVPFFFSYTPELIYSFWKTPRFATELEDAAAAFRSRGAKDYVSSYIGKAMKYREAGFDAQPRSEKKTGFEGARSYFRKYFERRGALTAELPSEPFDYYFRRPLQSLNPLPRTYVQIVPPTHFPRPDLLAEWSRRP